MTRIKAVGRCDAQTMAQTPARLHATALCKRRRPQSTSLHAHLHATVRTLSPLVTHMFSRRSHAQQHTRWDITQGYTQRKCSGETDRPRPPFVRPSPRPHRGALPRVRCACRVQACASRTTNGNSLSPRRVTTPPPWAPQPRCWEVPPRRRHHRSLAVRWRRLRRLRCSQARVH